MKKRLFLFPFFLIMALVCREPNAFCQSILNQPMSSIADSSSDLQATCSRIAGDIRILQQYGHMDSIDKLIWQAPAIGAFIVTISGRNTVRTYGDILHLIDSVRKTSPYQQLRKAIVTYVPPAREEKPDEAAREQASYNFQSFTTLKACLESAQKDKRKILLYFSGITSVNSRMMEKSVFTDDRVKNELADRYDSYILYADDDTHSEGTFKTVGDYIIDLQQHNFNADTQPYFVILSSTGKTIGRTGYTSNAEAFLRFLH